MAGLLIFAKLHEVCPACQSYPEFGIIMVITKNMLSRNHEGTCWYSTSSIMFFRDNIFSLRGGHRANRNQSAANFGIIVSAKRSPAYQSMPEYETISKRLEKLQVSFSRKTERVGYDGRRGGSEG